MSETVRLCSMSELADGRASRVEVAGKPLAVVRLGDQVFAVGDTCTHQNVSLSEGEVYPDDRLLECWKHGSTFDLVSGRPTCLPATKPSPVYETRVDGDDVMVVLP